MLTYRPAGGAFSYERGTPVTRRQELLALVVEIPFVLP